MAVEASEEIPYRARAYVVADGIAFGLNVNAVEPECVLVDHAVNSVIATAAKCAASIGDGTAKAHIQKQIDNKALKKLRWRAADAIKQFLRKGSLNLPMCCPHDLVGCLRLVRKCGCCRVLILHDLLS